MASLTECDAPGCGRLPNPHYGRLCAAHYWRLRRTGSYGDGSVREYRRVDYYLDDLATVESSWQTAVELAEALSMDLRNVKRSLRRLLAVGKIERRERRDGRRQQHRVFEYRWAA